MIRAAAALSLGAAVGCADPPPVPAPSSAAGDDAAPTLRGGAAPLPSAAPARGALDAFHADLAALQRGERRLVRIAVLGDSHTAADLWTGELRSTLQARFGDAGPGFIAVGVPGARHDSFSISQDGHTRTEPSTPSTVEPTGDGDLGLGGVLARPKRGKATMLLRARRPFEPKLRWEVCVRAGAEPARVTVTPRGGAPVARSFPAGAGAPPDRIATQTTAPHELEIRVEGDAALCGAIGETDPAERPGVVLDALGINGARLTTLLARDERAFSRDLSRRSPSLVVLEYGGNEAAEESTAPEAFGADLERVVARVRSAAPAASCLVVGPTEQVARPARTAAVARVLERRAVALGCAFWDAAERLGGPGAMQRMMDERPPRAHVDGIHLVERGYRDMARLSAEDLLRGLPPAGAKDR